jgi:hypothetical protein
MFNFYSEANTAAPWLVWLVYVGLFASAVTAVLKFGPPAWRTVSGFVETINALSALPEALSSQEDFRALTTATLAAQDLKIEEIHHEVHFNNGSSVKDAIERIEHIINPEPPVRAARKRAVKPKDAL